MKETRVIVPSYARIDNKYIIQKYLFIYVYVSIGCVYVNEMEKDP